MCSSIRYRFVLVCLGVGILFLLAGCANVSVAKPGVSNYVTSAPRVTVTTMPTAHAKIVARSSPVPGAPPTTTPQPTHKGGVTASSTSVTSSTGVSSSAKSSSSLGPVSTETPSVNQPAGTLTLTLACSGPHAQDGFQVVNARARACIYTAPGASLTIKVSFCNGKPDTSNALQGTFTADSHGFYAWNWTPQAGCQSFSSWSAAVTAQLQGQSAAISEASSSQGSPGSLPAGW